jgi:xylulose-5-phosphate/fructose-6-phosphate phosphoketolase
VKGYIEEGTTTTPFDLLVANGTSRYHLAIEALRRAPGWSSTAGDLIRRYDHDLDEHRRHILEHGADPAHLAGWRAP